jgi:hypothetical protein
VDGAVAGSCCRPHNPPATRAIWDASTYAAAHGAGHGGNVGLSPVGPEERGETGGWDAPARRGDTPWWSASLEWRARVGAWTFVILAIAGVIVGLVWGAWWLFVGEYQ